MKFLLYRWRKKASSLGELSCQRQKNTGMAGSEVFHHSFSPALYQSCFCLQVKSQSRCLNFQYYKNESTVPYSIGFATGHTISPLTWSHCTGVDRLDKDLTIGQMQGAKISYSDAVGKTLWTRICLMFLLFCWQESFRCRSSHNVVTQSMKTHLKKYGSHASSVFSCETKRSDCSNNWSSFQKNVCHLLLGSRCCSDIYGPAQIYRVQRRIPVVSDVAVCQLLQIQHYLYTWLTYVWPIFIL